ncbi:MAG: hypothetical protein LUO93_05705 [Methanomicrobiales archaeon]|nr:hypothetical protein [Methanomicrobiales archaeon]
MAVNQAQVDHILSSASSDDPEVKMQKIQDEVDLIKVSIKRLLIDIRERMNELENPFVQAVNGTVVPAEAREQAAAAREAAEVAHEAIAAIREAKSTQSVGEEKTPHDILLASGQVSASKTGVPPKEVLLGGVPHKSEEISDNLVEALRAQLTAKQGQKSEPPPRNGQEKLRLTKVHHLFEWTSRMVKKYGHDRLDMMLQSYRAMGYLTKESCEQVKEISKLMPSGLGESHDISPDEFIQELYALNRILDPSDTSLDRDMIEVLMEQRTASLPEDKKSPVGKENQDTWVRIPDGI